MKSYRNLLLLVILYPMILSAQSITGKLINQNRQCLSGFEIKLYINPNVYSATSGPDGLFTFGNITGVAKHDEQLPVGYAVSENFPNPFNPRTRIMFTLPGSGTVKILVFNLLGQRVLDEINRQFEAGINFIDLELDGLSSGIYIANIIIDDKYTVNKKLLLLYGSNHLSSSTGTSFPGLSKASSGAIFNSGVKLDSMIVIDPNNVRRVIKNLPDMNSNNLDLGNIPIIVSTGTPCVGIPTVTYGGKTYYTVQIGSQCWMNENLNTGVMIYSDQNQTNNEIIEKYCYDDDENNCVTYGGLYKWDEIMEYKLSSYNKGICPDGWHIPSIEEFDTLVSTVNNKSENLIAPFTQIASNNSSGFSALLGGFWSTNEVFSNMGQSLKIWTATEKNSGIAYGVNIDSLNSEIVLSENDKINGFSVRCLKDDYLTTGFPELVSPLNYSTNISISPALIWHSVPGAKSYTLQVSADSLFSNIIINLKGLTDTVKQVFNFKDTTKYYWRVSAVNNFGISNFSGQWLFTTENNIIRLADSTKQIESDPNIQSVQVASTSLIIEYKQGSNLPAIKPGDILIGNSGNGYLRKVVSSQEQNDKLIITTSDASLDEAFSKFQIDTAFTFAAPIQEIKSISYKKTVGNKTYSLTSSTPGMLKNSITNDTELNFPGLRYEINEGINNFSISADLKIIFNTSVEKFYIDLAKKDFSLIFNSDYTYSLSNLKIAYTGTIINETIPEENNEDLLTKDIFLGVIPIGPLVRGIIFSFNFGICFEANADAEGSVDLASTITSKSTYKVGANCSNGIWSPVWEKSHIGNCDVNVKPSYLISGGTKLSLKPKLYARFVGITGPGIFLKGYVYNEFSNPPFIGEMGFGSAAGLSFDVKFIFEKLAYYSTTLADFRWTMWKDTLNDAPKEPNNPIPVNGSTIQDPNVTLSWSCSDPDNDKLLYDVYFGQVNPPTIKVSTKQLSNSLELGALKNNTTYYWKIVASDPLKDSASSPVWSFTTPGIKPQSPVLISPANNSIDISLTPILVWGNSEQAESYSFQVSTDNMFSNLIYNQSGLIDTYRQISGLNNSTTYYWRVSAANENGTSEWSAVWAFKTIKNEISCASAGGVQIGSQCWQVQNSCNYCTWDGAMANMCPSGWHLPSISEFQVLVSAVNGDGNSLKAIGQGYSDENCNGEGTNTSGFSALLIGYYLSIQVNSYPPGYYGQDYCTYFWSSSENSSLGAACMYLDTPTNEIRLVPNMDKRQGFSVRCIKD